MWNYIFCDAAMYHNNNGFEMQAADSIYSSCSDVALFQGKEKKLKIGDACYMMRSSKWAHLHQYQISHTQEGSDIFGIDFDCNLTFNPIPGIHPSQCINQSLSTSNHVP